MERIGSEVEEVRVLVLRQAQEPSDEVTCEERRCEAHFGRLNGAAQEPSDDPSAGSGTERCCEARVKYT